MSLTPTQNAKTITRSPRSKTWHQLDLVLISCCHLNDCDTDHSLVISNMTLSPKPHHRRKQRGQTRVDIAKNCIRQLTADYNTTLKHRVGQLEENGNANEYWQLLKHTIHQSALDIFGVSSHCNPDWFVASLDTMKPTIEAKRKALLEFKSRPNVTTSARYREFQSLAQRTARQAHNLYYVEDK